jgi:hypothetical protein
MSLYLSCGICGRKQADGLLSRGYWGHLDAASRGKLCACPTCKEQHGDWETKLLAAANSGATASQPALGVGQSSFRL